METYIYIIATENKTPIKIGFSQNPEKRLKQLQTACAEKLCIFHTEQFDKTRIRLIERILHKNNRYKRKTGEWFNLTVEEGIREIEYAIIRYEDEKNLSNFL